MEARLPSVLGSHGDGWDIRASLDDGRPPRPGQARLAHLGPVPGRAAFLGTQTGRPLSRRRRVNARYPGGGDVFLRSGAAQGQWACRCPARGKYALERPEKPASVPLETRTPPSATSGAAVARWAESPSTRESSALSVGGEALGGRHADHPPRSGRADGSMGAGSSGSAGPPTSSHP
jgi:hypothetical protein